jgi:hypothetical protein
VVVDLMTEQAEPAHGVGIAQPTADRGGSLLAHHGRLRSQTRNDSQLAMPDRAGGLFAVGAYPHSVSAHTEVPNADHHDGCRTEHNAGEPKDRPNADGDSHQPGDQQNSPVQGGCPGAHDVLGKAQPPVPGSEAPLEGLPDSCGGDG